MAIRKYAPGEHPEGFVGLRVVASVAGEYRQKYFSTTGLTGVHLQIVETQAAMLEQEWKAESLWCQYQQFVTTSHPLAQPCRGVGVHGITAQFKQASSNWHAGFRVGLGRGVSPGEFMFKDMLYSEAWRSAVTLWANHNKVLPEDLERVLNNPPPPEQFKQLRRQMISEGREIPVEALRDVFRETREKLRPKATEPVGPEDIESWFRRAAAKLEVSHS